MTDRDTASEVEHLCQATREAHEAIAGIREVLRDVRSERAAVQQMLAGIEGRVQRAVGEQIDAQVQRQVDQLQSATGKAIELATEKVFARFDRIANILTGKEPGGRPLEDDARRYVEALGPIPGVVQ